MEVLVGVLGRAHGLDGAFVVQVRTDEPEQRFAVGARVRLDASGATAPSGVPAPKRCEVVRSSWVGSAFVVRFDWPNDRSTAEQCRGWRVWADVPDDAEPVDADEYHDLHLIGLEVRDQAGASVGQVVRVDHLPAQDVLAVSTPAGERLVPFVSALVPVVDVAGGYLVVESLPGLLDDGNADAR